MNCLRHPDPLACSLDLQGQLGLGHQPPDKPRGNENLSIRGREGRTLRTLPCPAQRK